LFDPENPKPEGLGSMSIKNLVEPPGGLGSCALLVERAARVLLNVLADVERQR
jgi:hypothetical protein